MIRNCHAPTSLWAVCALLFALCSPALAFELTGKAVQGGLMFGKATPGSRAQLDDDEIIVSRDGRFVLGFGRDESGVKTLVVTEPGGETRRRDLEIAKREYRIERVDGLPPKTVTPDPESLARIREDARKVREARTRRDDRSDYAEGFAWPASGRISGVYGSQRVLNGEPRRPHFGVDVAAPTGTAVFAPAAGIVTLAEPDLYYSGGTIVLDHGQGLSSSFLHLSEVSVRVGQRIEKGETLGKIGATGRATGPHLDWRMNWLDKRVDPQTLLD